MANRVLLNSTGLKVSRPGVNVLTASQANLEFNSDINAPNIYAKVTLNLVGGTTSTYNYGKTFSRIPVVMWQVNTGQGLGTGWLWGSGSTTDFAIMITSTSSLRYYARAGSPLHNTPLKLIIWDQFT